MTIAIAMRLFVVLLACFAAAEATSFAYTYEYYCAKDFVVFPPQSCYHYNIYFPTLWCRSSYYEPILKIYPGDECGTEDWEEKDPSDVADEMRDLLKTSLAEMTTAMYEKRDEWIGQLDAVHDEFKDNYKKYLTIYYDYRYECGHFVGVDYVSEREEKIKEYCNQLDETRTEILDQYDAAIATKIEALVQYHENIVQSGYDCLVTRLEKINEFQESVIIKVRDLIVEFGKYHLSIAEKKKEYYRSLLSNLFGSQTTWFVEFKADRVVDKYYERERMEIEKLIRQYTYKLTQYYNRIIQYYSCAYRCYMSNSCVRFDQRSYSYGCRRLAKCSTKTNYCQIRYQISPFSYSFKGGVYTNLKTCDLDAAAGSASAVVDDLRSKMEEALAERERRFNEWKTLWADYHKQYKARFEEIVKERHAWWISYVRNQYSSDGNLSSTDLAEIARLKEEFENRLEEVCAEYSDQLDAKIEECIEYHGTAQEEFRSNVERLITSIEEMLSDCKTKRDAAIETYRKKLEESRDEQRDALYQKVTKAKDAHWAKYQAMLEYFHGDECHTFDWVNYMSGCYSTHLYNKVCEVMHDFDVYWEETLSKLIQHYACGYKCAVKAAYLPTYQCGGYYAWQFQLPDNSCYSYQYTCYRRYCGIY